MANNISFQKTSSTDKWVTRAEYTTCKRPPKHGGHAGAYFATIWPTGPSNWAGMKIRAIHTASNLFPNHKFLVCIISILGSEPDRYHKVLASGSKKINRKHKPKRETEAEIVYNPLLCRLPSKLANESSY
jgi:hypothetical protein